MNKISIFTAVIVLLASVALVAPSAALAQYYYSTGYVAPASVQYGYNKGVCTDLTINLAKGSSDVGYVGQVSALQRFLIANGFLAITAPSGYFGAMTYQAVAQYQRTYNLSVTGYADAVTRLSIKNVSCGFSGYNNGYQYGYNNYYNSPTINSLSVSSGPVGTSVTVYGNGFDYSNNIVNFGGIAIRNIYSANGTSLTFSVPQVDSLYYNGNYTVGTYPISVTSSRGTGNSLDFTVTSNGYNNCYNSNYYGYNYNYNNCYTGGSLSVSNVSGPTNLTTGSSGVWSLSLYNPNSNYVNVSVRWGDESNGYYVNQSSAQSSYTQGQQNLTFSHTYQTAGYYSVVFTATDNQGAQTSVSVSVNVSGNYYSNSQPVLNSISPTSARVGTQVVLYGSGFSQYGGNTVRFGNGGAMNISSSNGTTLYYTIPYYVSPCDINSGSACALYAQQITPGTYPVSVSNSFGQTNTLYFTVKY